MARKAAKQGAKAGTKPAAPPATPPPPFSRAPELEPFLSTLDRERVYITHIDTQPAEFKKRIFAVPVLLNAGIAGLLLWRAWAALPVYWDMLLAALGNQTAHSVAREAATWAQLAGIAARRAAMFLADYVLVVVVGTWPLTFFAEAPGNPCRWRWAVGFRRREIYVRESRGWGAKELLGEETDGSGGEESPWFKTRVLPAIDKRYVREKTGYLMQNASWDLDFDAMVRAHKAVDNGEIEEGKFEKSVWVYGGEAVGWCVWEVHKLDHGAEDEGRKKIVAFKDRLTAMGKESLFFRWIELIQYESSLPGGFTPERQQDAVLKAKELFEKQGVDFEQFIKDLGGFEDMPGLENVGR
ncbi:uncharacterized protein LTHEOB_372 [Neofusicoccum parvum]|uniref:Uncharacterized protein n=2 Tax=Neofusicoccum parvum TaxID=310453 RepID=R1GGT7_BOTPV|nr:hypothetical protein UCRNP2_5787 [Neofusicoccum parvum UCRNP2]GME23486.1 uncharacterized protein LTHEOB_372 [Neofusicoccum parvum]GME63316.1 uncharacterized protein LTHEOB_372 [Neofusicoccum parvum]